MCTEEAWTIVQNARGWFLVSPHSEVVAFFETRERAEQCLLDILKSPSRRVPIALSDDEWAMIAFWGVNTMRAMLGTPEFDTSIASGLVHKISTWLGKNDLEGAQGSA